MWILYAFFITELLISSSFVDTLDSTLYVHYSVSFCSFRFLVALLSATSITVLFFSTALISSLCVFSWRFLISSSVKMRECWQLIVRRSHCGTAVACVLLWAVAEVFYVLNWSQCVCVVLILWSARRQIDYLGK